MNRLSQPPISRRGFLALSGACCVSLLAPFLGGCDTGPSLKAARLEEELAAGSDDVISFTDSGGRQVALPREITRVSPSGSYAQALLVTLCPDMLVNLAGTPSEMQKRYLPDVIDSLPALGRFYGAKNGDLNYEEIIRLDPDVIIDIGEHMTNIESDMDGLQEQTGLPVIFVEATMLYVASAYRTLGTILGVPERGEQLASYVDDAVGFAEKHHDQIAAKGLKVLYSTGEYGYEVKAKGTVHAGAVDLLGVDNVAVLDTANGSEVSPEQVMLWAPEVVILSPTDGFYLDIYDDPTWADIPAVKNRRVYEVPGKPYEWLDRPPSIQTVLGLQWLGNLLYPEIYDFDMIECAQEFFGLFWGYDLSDEEAREFLANSTMLRE